MPQTPLWISLTGLRYKWEARNSFRGPNYRILNVFLTSQTWMSTQQSNHPLWTHWLQICVPDSGTTTDTAFIYVGGGRSAEIGNPPTGFNSLLAAICSSTRSVVASLSAVPNQPIVFAADPLQKQRSEDALIAFTWEYFLYHNEPVWLARMPMTKAVVRAMDTVTAAMKDVPGIADISSFVVTGASKRGWTTWMTGAVDKRVVGIAPLVAPVADLVPQINEMYRSYGGWSWVLSDYVDQDLMYYLNTPGVFERIFDIVAPDPYFPRLTMPKYVVIASGDEFFMPSGPNYFWNAMLGEKLLYVVPDETHNLVNHQQELTASLQSWYLTIIEKRARPGVEFAFEADGTRIVARVTPASPGAPLVAPKQALMWYATNETDRDFRYWVCGGGLYCKTNVTWHSEVLHNRGGHVYIAERAAPVKGWTIFFVELHFDLGGLSTTVSFRATSGASTVPAGVFAHPPCAPDVCQRPFPPPMASNMSFVKRE